MKTLKKPLVLLVAAIAMVAGLSACNPSGGRVEPFAAVYAATALYDAAYGKGTAQPMGRGSTCSSMTQDSKDKNKWVAHCSASVTGSKTPGRWVTYSSRIKTDYRTKQWVAQMYTPVGWVSFHHGGFGHDGSAWMVYPAR